VSGRSAEVPAARFAGWVERFAAGHGGRVRLLSGPNASVLHAADGASASLDIAFAAPSGWPSLAELLAHVARPHPYALLLLRRGGWAVARVEGEQVRASRVGTRYVQGRSKKGGWSQQRFARRRSNQADSVVAAAVQAAGAVWGPPGQGRLAVVTGGDRLLLRDAVTALAAAGHTLDVQGRRLDVPDPRRAVLDVAARSAVAVRVAVLDADPAGGGP